MNKKAASMILLLFEVLVVVGIIFMAFQLAYKLGNDETVLKKNIADDLAMMVNTLVGTPGNGAVEYPHNVSKYSFILDSEKIKVLIKGESKSQHITSNFVLPTSYREEVSSLEGEDRLCLEKKDNKIRIRGCEKNEQ